MRRGGQWRNRDRSSNNMWRSQKIEQTVRQWKWSLHLFVQIIITSPTCVLASSCHLMIDDCLPFMQIDPALFPKRNDKMLQSAAPSNKYLVQQYQNFIIELQSSVFFVGDHSNDEIQRYSDRNIPKSSREFAALPAWVPEGKRHKYIPRDILLWLDVSADIWW